MSFGKQPLVRDHFAGPQRGVEIEAAQQPSVGDMRGQLSERIVRRQRGAQNIEPALAHRTGAGPQQDAGAQRIDGENQRRRHRIGPGL